MVPAALWGCGDGGRSTGPKPVAVQQGEQADGVDPSRPPDEGAGTGRFAIHEWGLIDVGARSGDLEVGGNHGPADADDATVHVLRPPDPVPPQPFPPQPVQPIPLLPDPTPDDGRARPAKPVLYVHLLDPGRGATFDLAVDMPGGAIIEHWPLTERRPEGVRWSRVTASDGACAATRYPTAADGICNAAPDGICEVLELRRYETADSACLSIGGDSHRMLFYRSAGPSDALPLAVHMDGRGGVTVARKPSAPGVQGDFQLLRVLRSNDDAQVIPIQLRAQQDRVVIARPPARAPCVHHDPRVHGRGHSCAEVRAEEAAEAYADFDRVFAASGLTEAEQEAFGRGWGAELVQPGSEGVTDALLYWLPAAAIDSILPLAIEPRPAEVKRAMLVRVDLTR